MLLDAANVETPVRRTLLKDATVSNKVSGGEMRIGYASMQQAIRDQANTHDPMKKPSGNVRRVYLIDDGQFLQEEDEGSRSSSLPFGDSGPAPDERSFRSGDDREGYPATWTASEEGGAQTWTEGGVHFSADAHATYVSGDKKTWTRVGHGQSLGKTGLKGKKPGGKPPGGAKGPPKAPPGVRFSSRRRTRWARTER